MSPLLTSLAAFACIFGGTFLGIYVRHRLPDRHLSGDTKDIVRQGTGLIATLASLVLGLLIASANGKYETQSSQIKQLTANVVLLDNTLDLYGQDAVPLRTLLRREIGVLTDRIWAENRPSFGNAKPFEASSLGLSVYTELLKLVPKTDAQRFLQARATDTLIDIGKTRLLLFTNAGNSIPFPFLIVLVGWLALIFASISLFAESNVRTIAILCVFSFAASAAIFLILELSQPFTGLLMISDQPLRDALSALPG
ncbi:MAG: bestrophin-like domain [Bradyrhizobium sp.]